MENFRLEGGVLEVFPGTEYLESEKFAENPEIRSVILPEGLKHVSVACFHACTELREVSLPSTLKSVDDGAFLLCENLHRILLPEGLEEISDLAFQESGLVQITVPASVKRIGEEAFFACPLLCEANVSGADTDIAVNAFGSNYSLIRGYIAPGFPAESCPGSELMYSLLWASCPDRHSEETSRRAEAFITANQSLVMERIFKYNNVPAMTGIAGRCLLNPAEIDGYVKQSARLGLTELTALLIRAKGSADTFDEEFAL